MYISARAVHLFDNCDDFRSLEPLNSVRLPRLSLYGNPLTEKEEYRVKVLLICPSLHTLDGQSAVSHNVVYNNHLVQGFPKAHEGC
mgnify:CR=1 FL=1